MFHVCLITVRFISNLPWCSISKRYSDGIGVPSRRTNTCTNASLRASSFTLVTTNTPWGWMLLLQPLRRSHDSDDQYSYTHILRQPTLLALRFVSRGVLCALPMCAAIAISKSRPQPDDPPSTTHRHLSQPIYMHTDAHVQSRLHSSHDVLHHHRISEHNTPIILDFRLCIVIYRFIDAFHTPCGIAFLSQACILAIRYSYCSARLRF